MWLLLVLQLVGLSVHGSGFEPLVDGWLCVATQAIPALVCWLALIGARGRRGEVTCLAIGISAFASGNAVLVLAEARGETLPVPSAADIGYLLFYPAVLVAVFRLDRCLAMCASPHRRSKSGDAARRRDTRIASPGSEG